MSVSAFYPQTPLTLDCAGFPINSARRRERNRNCGSFRWPEERERERFLSILWIGDSIAGSDLVIVGAATCTCVWNEMRREERRGDETR